MNSAAARELAWEAPNVTRYVWHDPVGGCQYGRPISTSTVSGRSARIAVTRCRVAGERCASLTTRTSERPAAAFSAAAAAWTGSGAAATRREPSAGA